MDVSAVLTDALTRVRESVPDVVADLDVDQLAWRPDAEANSIAWLVWHLSRVADDHVAGVAGTEQIWTRDGWYERFGLPFPPEAHGYGHSADDVAQVRVSSDLLAGYHDAVAASVVEYFASLGPADLDDVVDASWDPPVTLGVRLISVVNDCSQHLGQASYVRGLLERS
jgi:hypothetical protein